MLLRPNRFKWAWSCFSSAELAWCFTIFRPQDPTSLKKWVSLWKYPKKIMVNQSNHHFSPEVTSLFGVSLGSPNTPPVLGFPDVGWCPCHRCAQRQTSEPTWRGLPSPPRRDLRPHFYCLMGWLMMSKNPVKIMWKSRIATNFAEFDS